MPRSFLRNGRKQYGTGSSRKRHDHAPCQSSNTAIAGFARAVEGHAAAQFAAVLVTTLLPVTKVHFWERRKAAKTAPDWQLRAGNVDTIAKGFTSLQHA